MATFGNYPDNYLIFNSQTSKNLAIVMQIEGISDLYGIADTFTQVRYGDPGIVFGLPGLVYGALRRVSEVKPYIKLDGLTIGQKIEPEQGKGNIGTITLTLIDKNGEISKIVAPGVVVDEVIAKREVRLWLGFAQTSYPEDYLLIYKGYITQVSCPPGVVKFQISDSTTKKRQPIFQTPSTNLTSAIDNTQTSIPVLSTQDYHQQILGPDGTYDPIVRTYIKIENEWMEYGPAGIVSSTQFTVQRGGSHSLGTSPVSHSIDTQVTNGVELGGNEEGVNCITLALKLLLSGWNGPCETGISLLSFVATHDLTLGDVSNAFLLLNTDAQKDLGLTVGDYFYITGASHSGNNLQGIIIDIQQVAGRARLIYTDQTFIKEDPTSAVVAFRSKYDTLPVSCGVGCRMRDVDVETFEFVRNTYFVSGTSNIQLFYDGPMMGKDVIDTDIFLPVGCYSISRFGKISMSVAKPPLPGVGKLIEINWTNVINPDQISVTRATNNRNFFNIIQYQYDKDPVTGNYQTIQQFIDTDSLNLFDQTQTLPVNAPGLKSELGGSTIAQTRGRALLDRYKKCAIQIDLTVNWTVGSLIEVSDIILLRDDGNLKIMNFETGERNLGVQLFEVIDRNYDITQGNVKLKVMGGLGFNVDSRFGLYSPSSVLGAGSTSSNLVIIPSFGQSLLTKEVAKWTPYIGQRIQVHSYDYTRVAETTFVRLNAANPSTLDLDPPLPFTPVAGDLLEIPAYPTDGNKNTDATYKLLYAHFTPTIPVTSGISGTQFTVGLGEVGKLTVGNTVLLRKSDYSNNPLGDVYSAEIKLVSVVGTTLTLEKSLGFTPDNTYVVEGLGYHDGTAFYRYS